MVDPDKIRSLVELMAEHELAEISIRSGDEEVVIKRAIGVAQMVTMMPAAPAPVIGAASNPPSGAASPPAPAAPAVDENAGLVAVKSPMVGTFYAAPEPGAEPYVRAGSRVTAGQTVCIVEAMKIMNEIEAEFGGVVREVLVEDATPVEFGQVLFRIDPNG